MARRALRLRGRGRRRSKWEMVSFPDDRCPICRMECPVCGCDLRIRPNLVRECLGCGLLVSALGGHRQFDGM